MISLKDSENDINVKRSIYNEKDDLNESIIQQNKLKLKKKYTFEKEYNQYRVDKKNTIKNQSLNSLQNEHCDDSIQVNNVDLESSKTNLTYNNSFWSQDYHPENHSD